LEWDQLLFYKGHKLLNKIKNNFKQPNPYYNYEIQDEEIAILRFLLILNPEQIQLVVTQDKISISSNTLYFPKSIRLFKEKGSSKRMILLLLTFMSLSLSINSIDRNNPLLKKASSNRSFMVFYRIARGKFSAIHEEWKEFIKSLRMIRNIDQKQFEYLKKLILSSTNRVSMKVSGLQAGRDFNSKMEKKNVETKDSQQKLNLDEAELLEVDEKKIDEYTLGHSFEKIETVEEFDGQWRDIDGEEDMEEEEALQELDLKHVIRTEDAVHSTRTTDSGSGTMIEIESHIEKNFTSLYPEWDYKKKSYKKDYCSVKEENYVETDLNYVVNVLFQGVRNLNKLRKKLEILINERLTKKRLSSGTDIDIDALITRFADITAKKTPSEFIYTNSHKHHSDITLYFLMDMSLSTDSWIHGKRIIDVEKESLILFSECLYDLQIPFGIGGFYSRTRNHCKFLSIKNISDDWASCKYRMGSLSPIGYTRIGPALRHSLTFLKDCKSKQKWIILLTDAKPNDYDKYEGKYGIEDVNQAVKECLMESVQIHTLAIGTDEKPTIPAMMRNASFQMLLYPEKLLDSLQNFLKRALIR
jgi:nitric oxide reductase NorD protein